MQRKHQMIAAWVFGSITLVFLMVIYLLRLNTHDPVIRLIAAILAGLMGYFITGSMKLVSQGKIADWGKISIQAGGGAAFFALVFLTWPKDGTHSQRNHDDVLMALAGMPLTDLEVAWRFPMAPPQYDSVFQISEMIIDSKFLSDDERSRMPAEIRALATQAWHIESAVTPLIACIAEGRKEVIDLYAGEDFETARSRYADKDVWVDGIGSSINYAGPHYEVLFPLNLKGNAMLSLGNRDHDVVLKKPAFPWQEDDPDLFDRTNYGFKVSAQGADKGFTIYWNYDQPSLLRAVERGSNVTLTAGLPKKFSFIIVTAISEWAGRAQLVRILTGEDGGARDTEDPEVTKSELQVIVNGLKERKLTYAVTKAGTFSTYRDLGAYDAPEQAVSYVRFDCSLSKID